MDRPYAGIRVLDLTHDLGRYVGRLFADLGAEVLRVEPPEGLADRHDRTASGRYRFAFLNASKHSRVIDLDAAEGRTAFAGICASASVVLLERGGPLFDELEWIRAAARGLVITSVSPFGRDGPWSDRPASDLVLQAAGGISWLTGRLDAPPLRLPGGQATMITGVYAAAATAIALHHALATGQGHVVDVSAQECIAHSLQHAIQVWDCEGIVSMRGGEGTRDASDDIFACKDGHVFLAAAPTLGVSWKALVAWIGETGHPAHEELAKPRWRDAPWRMTGEAKAILRAALESFTAQFTKHELLAECQKRKIVLGPVATPLDVLGDPQLAYQSFFRALQLGGNDAVAFPGPPYRFSEPVWAVSPAPSLGAVRATLAEETR